MKIDKILTRSLLIIMFVNLIDLIVTIIGLKLYLVEEMNPIHHYFFSLGNIGFFISFIFNIIATFFMLIFIDYLAPKLYKKLEKREYDHKLRRRTFIVIIVTIVIMETIIIINNIGQMI